MSRLRVVFDKFDVDKSGCVSTDEMTQMVKSLKLNLTASDIKQLMKDADPDGSGSIEFEEFASVLKAQLKAGKGGLANVVTEASSAWGFLNPMHWFASEEPTRSAAPSPAPPATTPKKMSTKPGVPKASASKDGQRQWPKKPTPKAKGGTPKGTPKGKVTPKGKKSAARTTSTPEPVLAVRSPSERSPNGPMYRMKKTQGAVQEANHRQAAEHRAESQAAKDWWAGQQEQFLSVQHERVLRGHQQAVERAASIEALKHEKRQLGSEMRKQIERKMEEQVEKKRQYVAAAHNTVYEARKKHQSVRRARIAAERENQVAISEAAKQQRAERKEETKATVRREEQAARDYAAQVKWETRPEVREEGAALFQAMRTTTAEEARQKAKNDARAMRDQQAAYLQAAEECRQKVSNLHARAAESRESLAERKKREAAVLRAKLEQVRETKKRRDQQLKESKKMLHDEIHEWNTMSIMHP